MKYFQCESENIYLVIFSSYYLRLNLVSNQLTVILKLFVFVDNGCHITNVSSILLWLPGGSGTPITG